MPGITRLRAESIAIGALSKRTGVHIETIRYYERIAVMPKPRRSAGGHRVYDETALRRLGFIHRSRKLGFSLNEIRTVLSLVDGRTVSCADIRDLTIQHAGKIRRKITELKKLERVLKDMAAQCHGDHAPDCAIVNALFGAGDQNQR